MSSGKSRNAIQKFYRSGLVIGAVVGVALTLSFSSLYNQHASPEFEKVDAEQGITQHYGQFGEGYYIGINLEDAAAMMLLSDVAPPSSMEYHIGKLWGFIDTEELPKYVDYIAQDSLYAVSRTGRIIIGNECNGNDPACILQVFE